MDIDLELYRREVRVSADPRVRLSAIDIAPELAKQTFVLLHGFGGQASQWRYQLQQFSQANRVIALDLRGHGQSDSPTGSYTMAEIQSDLEQALALLQAPKRFVLAGHSFGGAIATEYASAHPERVERLILIATAGEFRLSPLLRLAFRLPNSVARLLRPMTAGWLHAPFHALKAWYHNTLSPWNGWSLFRGLTVPTLVIRGHWDLLFDRPLFEEVSRAIPGSEEVDVGVSGHMVMLERRDAVNRAIARFVSGETTRSWRGQGADDAGTARKALIQERPWLRHYDNSVPYTTALPAISVYHLLRSAVRRFPHRTALLLGGRRLTYSQLNREVNRLANTLIGLGLQPGDRAMILAPNLPQTVMAFYAILKAGGVVVMAPPQMDAETLATILTETEARILVAWAGYDELIPAPGAAPTLAHILIAQTGDYLPWWKRLRAPTTPLKDGQLDFRTALKGQSRHAPPLAENPQNVALIQYTGGTTGKPKGVMLTHHNLVANTLQTRHWMAEAQEGAERFLCVIPFTHIYGLTASLNLAIALGATLILKPRFDLADILQTIKRYKPTIFPGTPAMYMGINTFPGVRKYGIGSIKLCISGSAPLPLEVQESFEKLTRGRLAEGYGLTEAGPVTHANPLRNVRKAGSIGIPLPSTDARILELSGSDREVAAGQIGELAVQGPQVMAGYWRDEAATRQVLTADGWLRTGDVAQMDGDGYFHIIARKADMWYPERQETPAFPRDVEEVLFEIPQVQEAAVVAVANQPIAFVIVGRERVDGDTVLAYCRRRLPPELVPRMVIFVDDLPRTIIGKVLRRELVRLANQRREELPKS